MTIDEMRARKTELGYTSEMIAKMSGIPLSTVQKIFGGITKAPRKSTIDAIVRVLEDKDEQNGKNRRPGSYGDGKYANFSVGGSEPVLRDLRAVYGGAGRLSSGGTPRENESMGGGAFKEAAGNYNVVPKDGRYTIDDYYALPEDQRAELIDGVFYDMGAPALIHQRILSQLHILFEECAEAHGQNCEVYIAPCDVRLDMDNYTMVQPDLLVICREYDIHAIRHEGAPDLVVEILSPSTRSKDMILKLYKYRNAGVREYWIVDPKHRSVTVHNFEEEDYDPKKYGFEDRIPIGISGGSCVIDFSRIMAKIKRYYED